MSKKIKFYLVKPKTALPLCCGCSENKPFWAKKKPKKALLEQLI